MIVDIKEAARDIHKALYYHQLWMALGKSDILARYRRSWLGPLWITLSMAIIGGALGSLYSGIMQHPMSEYIPYLVIGYSSWNLISSLISEGTESFVRSSAAIREIPVPYPVYIYRIIYRNILVFGHNLIVYFTLLFIFPSSPFPSILLLLPALVIIVLNGVWVGLLLGVLNVKYRDLSQFINNLMRLFFFVTPIIWFSDLATGLRSMAVHLNPFYYFIEIIRSPLLGSAPSLLEWSVTLSITVSGWVIAIFIYARMRKQIAYWV